MTWIQYLPAGVLFIICVLGLCRRVRSMLVARTAQRACARPVRLAPTARERYAQAQATYRAEMTPAAYQQLLDAEQALLVEA